MSRRTRLTEIVKAMSGRQIVVFGDLIADRFVYAVPQRISREAPVLILRQQRVDTIPGGGGNALANLASLGASAIAVSVTGRDSTGDEIVEGLKTRGVDVSRILRTDVESPSKTRVLAGLTHATKQQVVRIDSDAPLQLTREVASRLTEHLSEAVEHADGVIISDYGYGVAEPERCGGLEDLDVPVTLDSRHRLREFPPVSAATPNEEEASEAAGVSLFEASFETLSEAGNELLRSVEADSLLITRGSLGMALFRRGHPGHLDIGVHGTDQIADVTGAGDTVIATFTLALAAGADAEEAARISNIAGGIVVMKMGTATVTADELIEGIASSGL